MLLKLRNAEAVQATSRHWKKGPEQILLTALGRNQLCQHLELLASAFQSQETIEFGCLSTRKHIHPTTLSSQLFSTLSISSSCSLWSADHSSVIGKDTENNQYFPASYNRLHRSQKEQYSFVQTTSPGHKKHPHCPPQGH